MAYTVTITYNGIDVDADLRIADPISRIMVPTSSYIDSAVYREGHPAETVTTVSPEFEFEGYGKSIYATNVLSGIDSIPMPDIWSESTVPMSVPLAQFRMAVVGEDDGNGGKTRSFDVEDYKEAFYYMELGVQLKDQGFTVEVAPK